MHPLVLFRYCPRCGSSRFEEHNEKAKKCRDCGFVYYFNSCSATVALILNSRNELLVTRRAKEPAKGTFDLPGGFIDMYETGEEGVAREVKEETGFTVRQSTYLFSLPNIYPFSGFDASWCRPIYREETAKNGAFCKKGNISWNIRIVRFFIVFR